MAAAATSGSRRCASWQISTKDKLGIYYNNNKKRRHQRSHQHLPGVAGDDVFLPVLRSARAVVAPAHQPAAVRSRVLAASGNMGQPARDERSGGSAGRRRHRQQPADAGSRLHSTGSELSRTRRRELHAKPQSELPRQLLRCRMVTGAHSWKTESTSTAPIGRRRGPRRTFPQLRRGARWPATGGRRHSSADNADAPLRWLHGSAHPSGQRKAGRRPHFRPARLPNAGPQQGDKRGGAFRTGGQGRSTG